jgi:hypothetical protein
MGLTLLEAAKTDTNQQRVVVIRALTESQVIASVPFLNVDGGIDYLTESELPGVGFRALNEGYEASYGVMNPDYERLKPFGGDIDVDLHIIKNRGPGAKVAQIEAKLLSMRKTLEDYWFNGDESVDPRAFDGLKKRIGTESSQAFNSNGAFSLSKLDELIDSVDGDNKVIHMGRPMRRLLTAASRSSSIGGFLTTTRNEFGKLITTYGETPIVVTDTNAQNVPIQGFTEAGSTTSVYCVAYGDQQVTGIQGPDSAGGYGIDVTAFGQVQDAPVDRTRLEWSVGLAIMNGKAAARAYGITNAAMTA